MRGIKSKALILILIIVSIIIPVICFSTRKNISIHTSSPNNYIKWVDFSVPYRVLEKALTLDIKSNNTNTKLNWIELIAYLGAKYGGDFSKYNSKDLDTLVEKLKSEGNIENLTGNMKYYKYFFEAYNAVLKDFVGDYQIEINSKDNPNIKEWKSRYGLKVFSPIARGYQFHHYDDFGNSRSFGFKRRHLGNDLMGAVGTPIIAVESGIIEVLGWNQYGGWRIGIRSFDKKRYYYYAHLRKDTPYHKDLYVGKQIKAGDVIGYLGMTGYSKKENVCNIEIPHLHFGMQLIFDESQKDGINQIWIDVYNIVELLQKNKSSVFKDPETKDYYRIFDYESN